MGQGVSGRPVCVSLQKDRSSLRSSSRRRMPRFGRHYGRELSEAFNMITDDFHVDFLNVNVATEEQLMTLPGICRRTAQNIVEYRNAVGHFKKVEDLAIVSGVGAKKLDMIRSEITVYSRRKGLSRSSSSATWSDDSVDADARLMMRPASVTTSVSSGNSHCTPTMPCTELLDVNTAGIFQLMSVRGISQEMAANLVHYREKRGCLRSVEELTKVRGFNGRIVGELKRYLTVNPESLPVCETTRIGRSNKPWRRRHRRSSSVPAKTVLKDVHEELVDRSGSGVGNCGAVTEREVTADAVHVTDSRDIYELLATKCLRPCVVDRFVYRRHGRSALRVATWNLDQFGCDKAENYGVIEVICLTILETGVSMVALQEITSSQVLEKVCQELNNPCLSKVQGWVGPRGFWKFLISDSVGYLSQGQLEFLGFLYDTSRGISPRTAEVLSFPKPNNNEPPFPGAYFATFRIEGTEFSLLCVHLPKCNKKNESPNQMNGLKCDDTIAVYPMAAILRMWHKKINGADHLLVLGDFGTDPLSKELNVLREHNFSNVTLSGESSSCNTATSAGSVQNDNIWINSLVTKFFTGHWDVVRSGLSHLAIPNGWKLGGSVSSHCPVWAEFFVPPLDKLMKNERQGNKFSMTL